MKTAHTEARPQLRLIVAYSRNRVIGRDNTLPWRLPGDLKHFKQQTLGHPIIMGRHTWESLGRPLPGRLNIVVSRSGTGSFEGASVARSFEQAIELARDAEIAYIIGGANLYAQTLDTVDAIIATEIDADIEGDAHFPALAKDQWKEVSRESQPEENGLAYDFVTYQRLKKNPSF